MHMYIAIYYYRVALYIALATLVIPSDRILLCNYKILPLKCFAIIHWHIIW